MNEIKCTKCSGVPVKSYWFRVDVFPEQEKAPHLEKKISLCGLCEYKFEDIVKNFGDKHDA